ncbi:hypothetical protein ACFV0T_19265 [Streptomyces sp. NPDC059582]|uniref:hypothetical protein n=1 Tax=Streptomyces sp. NPDC059582 TaxID=3346875 RepID=UPI0036750D6E
MGSPEDLDAYGNMGSPEDLDPGSDLAGDCAATWGGLGGDGRRECSITHSRTASDPGPTTSRVTGPRDLRLWYWGCTSGRPGARPE